MVTSEMAFAGLSFMSVVACVCLGRLGETTISQLASEYQTLSSKAQQQQQHE